MTPLISVGRIGRLLGVDRKYLFALAGKAERLYTQKRERNGRVVSAPSRELKRMQRLLTRNVLGVLPVSSASYCVKGGGVVLNARQHMSDPYMVIIDLSKCFPSTTYRAVNKALRAAGMTDESAGLVTRLVTLKGALPQGAPTSSMVLDAVLYDADTQLEALAREYEARYTRYADDLCFSGNRELSVLARRARQIVSDHGFQINKAKFRVFGPDDQRVLTNVVVTSELNTKPGYLVSPSGMVKTPRL